MLRAEVRDLFKGLDVRADTAAEQRRESLLELRDIGEDGRQKTRIFEEAVARDANRPINEVA